MEENNGYVVFKLNSLRPAVELGRLLVLDTYFKTPRIFAS
jgi:hypothetical protein